MTRLFGPHPPPHGRSRSDADGRSGGTALDLSQRPLLVFWETTRACMLACRHCRASALQEAAPGEMTAEEGMDLVRQVADFGHPSPILILTGGDCLMRKDVFQVVRFARSLGITVAMSPSVTPRLDPGAMAQMRQAGVRAVSISLDGALEITHDGIRGVEGHFKQTLSAVRSLVVAGFRVQVNTTVMRANASELADVFALVRESDAHIWEVFFLVNVGRGVTVEALDPAANGDVCHFLHEASSYGVTVRTVEAPFYRRITVERRLMAQAGAAPKTLPLGPLYHRLSRRLAERVGRPTHSPAQPSIVTRDGQGLIFVAHDGEVLASGFLPLSLGNVRSGNLASIYREHPVLKSIRKSAFSGACGTCAWKERCGGSRARAFNEGGDALGEDPACPFRETAMRRNPALGAPA